MSGGLEPRVLAVVADHLRVPLPAPGASLADDLGADSLAVLDLAMRLEDELDVWLDDAALLACRTAGDLVTAVERAAAARLATRA